MPSAVTGEKPGADPGSPPMQKREAFRQSTSLHQPTRAQRIPPPPDSPTSTTATRTPPPACSCLKADPLVATTGMPLYLYGNGNPDDVGGDHPSARAGV
ncbi:MAG: hypothetical protein R2705_18475 [Ilumatobacteraceae bacterium]